MSSGHQPSNGGSGERHPFSPGLSEGLKASEGEAATRGPRGWCCPLQTNRKRVSESRRGMGTEWRTGTDPRAVPGKPPSIHTGLVPGGLQGQPLGQGLIRNLFPSPWPGPRTPPNASPREFQGQKRERIPQILKSTTEKLCNSGFRCRPSPAGRAL